MGNTFSKKSKRKKGGVADSTGCFSSRAPVGSAPADSAADAAAQTAPADPGIFRPAHVGHDVYHLHNHTTQTIRFAVYFDKMELSGRPDTERATHIVVVAPQQRATVPKPSPPNPLYHLYGVVADERDDPNLLSDSIEWSTWEARYKSASNALNLALLVPQVSHTCIVYMNKKNKSCLKTSVGYQAYKVASPFKKVWNGTVDKFRKALNKEFTKGLGTYRYANQTASVRYGKDTPAEEQAFVLARLEKARGPLGKFLDMDLSAVPVNQLPRIGIACSGGGYRALLSSLGVLLELERQGLLDCVVYTAGLSGGSWLLSHIYASPNKTLIDLLASIKKKFAKDFYSADIFGAMKLELRERLASGADLSIIDEFSWLLHRHMFADFPAQKDLWGLPRISEQTERIADGAMPMPIYTSVTAVKAEHYHWVEVTPFEAGIRDDVGAFVPTFAYGRKFVDNKSVDTRPEPSLSLSAGICGSAFVATVDEIFSSTTSDEKTQRILHQLLYHKFPTVGEERLFTPASVPNFANTGVLHRVKNLKVMDGGCAINVPFAPLLRPERGVDVILALEQSAGLDQLLGTNLKLGAEYAKKYQWSFPDVTAATTTQKDAESGQEVAACSTVPMTVLQGDAATGVPTVLFQSLIKNTAFDASFDPRTASWCGTTNWTWTADQIDLLTGLTAQNTRDSIDKIKAALATALKQKMGATTVAPAAAVAAAGGSGQVHSILDGQ